MDRRFLTAIFAVAMLAANGHRVSGRGREDMPAGMGQNTGNSAQPTAKYDFVRLKEKYKLDFTVNPDVPEKDHRHETSYLMPPSIALPGWEESLRDAVNDRRRELARKAVDMPYLYSLSFFDFYDYIEIDEEKAQENGVGYYRMAEPAIREYVLNGGTFSPAAMFRELFGAASGKDIDRMVPEGVSGRVLTKPQREAVAEYNAFAMVAAEEIEELLEGERRRAERLAEYAVIANDVYEPLSDDFRAARETGWVAVTAPAQMDCPLLRKAFAEIQNMNKGLTNMGFHARIYRHREYGEYAVAFSGTNLKTSAVGDLVTNVKQLTSTPRQYKNAKEVALMLKDSKARISFVGHSLGGGLATVAGLITGFDTYIYNPADLSDATMETIRGHIHQEHSIYAFATSSDPVTGIQQKMAAGESARAAASSKAKKGVGLHPVEKIEIEYIPHDPSSERAAAASSSGLAEKVAKIADLLEAHSMQTMEDYFKEQYFRKALRRDGMLSEIWKAVDSGTLFAYIPEE